MDVDAPTTDRASARRRAAASVGSRLTRMPSSGTSSWERGRLHTVNAEGKIVEGVDTRDEWLEADGLGGFASGTVCGIRTRRYHAILLAATSPPAGRVV